MITDFNDSVADLSSDDDPGQTTKELKPNVAVSSDINHSKASSIEVPSDKTVRFDNSIGLFHLDAVALEEKQVVWYDCNDFEKFKYEAAEEAGLKLIRSDPEKSRKGRFTFTMVGDFDHQIKSADAGSASKSAIKKLYYNENEYSDSNDGEGGVICKRGLGWHFSRNRKKSRVVTRTVVLAWQKMLQDESDAESRQNLPSLRGRDGETLGKLEKTRAIMALMSAKCSRIAREEARWRGDVDCRVARPEQYALAVPSSSLVRPQSVSSNSAFDAGKSNDSTCIGSGPLKKRMRGDANAVSRAEVAACKKQRTVSGGCRSVIQGLSSPPITSAGGMLQAKV